MQSRPKPVFQKLCFFHSVVTDWGYILWKSIPLYMIYRTVKRSVWVQSLCVFVKEICVSVKTNIVHELSKFYQKYDINLS